MSRMNVGTPTNAVTTSVKGETGLTRGANGHVVALIATCGSNVSRVDVVGSREGLREDEVNPTLGASVASRPVTGTIRLDLESENPGWTTSRRLTMPKKSTKRLIVGASDRGADTETSPTSATPAQLRALASGKVLRNDGSTVPEGQFLADSCTRGDG